MAPPDPELHTIPGKPVTKEVYDPILDDVVEREFTTPDREVRTPARHLP